MSKQEHWHAKDLAKLTSPSAWLNDDLINGWMELIVRRSETSSGYKSVFALNSYDEHHEAMHGRVREESTHGLRMETELSGTAKGKRKGALSTFVCTDAWPPLTPGLSSTTTYNSLKKELDYK